MSTSPEPGSLISRSHLIDAILFAGCGFIAVIVTQSQIRSGTMLVTEIAEIAAAVVGCLALWLRRRWPVPIAATLSVLTCFSPACQLPALISLGTVSARRPGRPLLLIMLVQIVSTLARLLLKRSGIKFSLEIHLSSTTTGGSGFIVSFLVAVLVILAGLYARARRRLIASLREQATKAEAEQQLRIGQARSGERTRIAREMHDVLAHRISLISLQASAFQVRRDRSPEEVTEFARQIRSSAHQTLDDLREVIGVLRPEGKETAALTPQPDLGDIPTLVDESARTGMTVSLDQDLGDLNGRIPTPVGRTAYRVVQEGLTNARKHAPGAQVSVTLEGTLRTGLLVEICNRRPVLPPAFPAGAAPIPGAGQGLVGLSERADLLGGRLTHGSTSDGAFRLSVWLPLGEEK